MRTVVDVVAGDVQQRLAVVRLASGWGDGSAGRKMSMRLSGLTLL
jgi:hypothetical protein